MGEVIEDAHVKRRLKVLKSTSASQMADYSDVCPRYWYARSVEGLKEPEEDRPPHLKRGSHIDKEIELYLEMGVYRDKVFNVQVDKKQPDGTIAKVWRTEDWKPLVRAMVALMPDRAKHELQLQLWATVPTYPGGPTSAVKPDVMHEPEPGWLHIDDAKTTSDYIYCKSRDELSDNTQLITYTRWGYEVLGASKVTIAHVYGRTGWDYKNDRPRVARAHRSLKPHGKVPGVLGELVTCECSECKSWLSDANNGRQLPDGRVHVTREQVAASWAVRVGWVREMTEYARSAKSMEELPPNTASCGNVYGQPCPFRARCGHEQISIFGGGSTMGEGGLFARLKAKEAQAAAATPEPAKPQLCNGKGQYEYPNGHAPLAVEAGHACEKCNTGTGVMTGKVVLDDNRQVLPPESADKRTSTPADSDKAEEKAKRGRPKKTGMTTEETIDATIKLTGMGFTGDQAGKILKSGHLEATLQPIPEEKPAPAELTIQQAKEQLLKIGFSVDEINTLFFENSVDEALAGRITTGMMRQMKIKDEPVATPDTKVHGSLDHKDPPISHVVVNVLSNDQREDALAMELQNAAAMTTGHQNHNQLSQSPRAVSPHVAHTDAGLDLQREAAASEQASQIESARQKFNRPTRKAPPVAPTIYVDCYPVKGGTQATALEVWLAPVAELAALAATNRDGKPAPAADWRMVPYESRGLLAAAIRETIDSLPAVIVVDSRMSGSEVFLEVVTPHAALVIRAIR